VSARQYVTCDEILNEVHHGDVSQQACPNASLIRLTLRPTAENGLRKPSQIMIDKAMTVKRGKLGEPFGRLDDETIISVNRSLALFFGFA
jgi:mRNA interferase MazF